MIKKHQLVKNNTEILDSTNLHAPALGMKFLREVDRLAKQGVEQGEEENLVLAVY